MKVHAYERAWLWASTVMIAGFLGAVVFSSVTHPNHPPTHIETGDPESVGSHPDFSNPRVETRADGSALVVGTAQMFSFAPDPIVVKAGAPVTFRLTSPDVIHGFQVVGTNVNAMIVPGYVTRQSVTFPKAGEYLVVCNEYCGLAHHIMQARIVVE